MGESFWEKDSLITSILLELQNIMIFSPVASFGNHSLISNFIKQMEDCFKHFGLLIISELYRINLSALDVSFLNQENVFIKYVMIYTYTLQMKLCTMMKLDETN